MPDRATQSPTGIPPDHLALAKFAKSATVERHWRPLLNILLLWNARREDGILKLELQLVVKETYAGTGARAPAVRLSIVEKRASGASVFQVTHHESRIPEHNGFLQKSEPDAGESAKRLSKNLREIYEKKSTSTCHRSFAKRG